MKIKHVYLTTSLPARLAEFYTRIGLPIRFVDEGKWTQFGTEGTAFCVSSREESAAPAASNAVVVFEVERLEAAIDRAVAAGATVKAPTRNMGSGRVAQLRDPDGNMIQFFEPSRGPRDLN
jgi:predicted enzyme related to lactoylglutathione lyase